MSSFLTRAIGGAFAAASTVTAMWGVTQWTAGAFGFHAALGAPWFSLLGYPVYAPWKFFPWWLQFDANAPGTFLVGGATIAATSVISGAIAFGVSAWRDRVNVKANTYGSARWATFKDIQGAGLFEHRGVILGQTHRRYLRHDGPEHVLAVAPTRTGKGVGLVVPTLFAWINPAIIHDIKGENWNITAGWRSQFTKCLRFDPTDPNTTRFNPLMEIRKGPNEVRDAQNIADILVDPEGSKQVRSHWEDTAHALLTGVILHVLYAEKEKTLNRVATFLAGPGRTAEDMLEVMLHTNHVGTDDSPLPHPEVVASAQVVRNKSPNELSGVLSTAVRFVTLYRDPLIANATSQSDWRIEDIGDREYPLSLYLVVPPSDISRTRPLIRLILNQILRRLTESHEAEGAAAKRRRILLMLDEFPALGRLDFFETSLAFLGGYGVKAFLVAQSLNQLDKAYGTNNAILDNCHVRVAFATNDERTASRLAKSLGTATEQRALRNLSGKRFAPWLSHVSVASQETPRPLLTPGEIMQLPAGEAIVMVAGLPPIRAQKIKHYADRVFLDRCRPPPLIENRAPSHLRPPVETQWSQTQPARNPNLDAWLQRKREGRATMPKSHELDLDLTSEPSELNRKASDGAGDFIPGGLLDRPTRSGGDIEPGDR